MKNTIIISSRSHAIMGYFAERCRSACVRGFAAKNTAEAERAEYELKLAVRNLCSAISTCAGHAITRSRS